MADLVIQEILELEARASIDERLEEMEADNPELIDQIITLTNSAAYVNRRARIIRGRRTERAPLGGPGGTSNVTPGVTLTQPERNRRSQERIVAEYDPDPEEIETTGWKKLVQKARAKRRESAVAAPDLSLVPENPEDWTQGDTTLLWGDFRERLDSIPDGSVDLIVTDPPYDKESLEIWSDLSGLASRLLGPRGILFAWTGKIFLPDVMDRLADGLTYGWMFNLDLPGANSRIIGRHIIQTWKPILAYSKDTWPMNEWGPDNLTSVRSKGLFEWEQDVSPAELLIRHYSPPDGLILDPMLGVGSFGVAAQSAGRRFLGVELDKGRYQQSIERLSE